MYVCDCQNLEATLVVVRDAALPEPIYLSRTGDSTHGSVSAARSPTAADRATAARTGFSKDVVCPHCESTCAWGVCTDCGVGGDALGDIEPSGRVRCRACGTRQHADEFTRHTGARDYYYPN